MTEPTPPYLTLAARAAQLIPAVTALLAVFCVVAISGIVSPAWPFHPSEARWRYASVGLFLATEPQIVLLLIIMAVANVLVGAHQVVRGVALALLLLAIAVIVAVPFFALDFLTVRHVQPQAALGAFTREGLRVAGAAAVLVPFMVWCGVRGWAASIPDPGGDVTAEGHGLVVGQPI